MSLFRAIRTIILGPPTMASVRLSSWTTLWEIAYLYQIQHAADDKGFTGWVMVSRQGRLEAELEGPKDELEKFLNRLTSGELVGREIPIERAWGTFQDRYPNLKLRLPEFVFHDRDQRAS